MGLKERVAGARSTTLPGPACAVSKYLAVLAQDDADALLHLLYERLDLSGAEVSEFLADDEDEPVEISQYVVNRHRLGRCSTCNRRSS